MYQKLRFSSEYMTKKNLEFGEVSTVTCVHT